MTSTPKRTRRRVHVPPFVPVPVRSRRDGWTARRQADFLGALAETRSVSEAARRVGMARENAHRLRARPDARSFAAAWDVALGRARAVRHPSRNVTGDELWHRALWGGLQPHFYRGKYTGTARKYDNTALLRVVRTPCLAAGFGYRVARVTWADPCNPLNRAEEARMWWPRCSWPEPAPSACGRIRRGEPAP